MKRLFQFHLSIVVLPRALTIHTVRGVLGDVRNLSAETLPTSA